MDIIDVMMAAADAKKKYGNSVLRWDETQGRRAFAYDTVNLREQLIYGDTGWRQYAIPANWPVGGNIYLRRFGHSVFCFFSITLESTPGYSFAIEPAGVGWTGWTGFSDALGTSQPLVVRQVTGSAPQFATVSQSGPSLTITGLNAVTQAISGFSLSGYLSWSTIDPWPVTLPGVSVIAPPVG